MSPEDWAAASSAIGSPLDIPLDQDPDRAQAFAALDQIKAQTGKPVVIVTYGLCPPKNNPNTYRWAIGGDLAGSNPAGCGSGFQASMEDAIAAVKARAERKRWSETDYVLLIDQT